MKKKLKKKQNLDKKQFFFKNKKDRLKKTTVFFQTLPFGLTKSAAIHKQAGEQLHSLMADYPSAPLDMPIAKYDNHTPLTMYYGGHLVHYHLRNSLPQLVVYHSFQPHTVPVDQDFVRVAKD